VRRSGSSRCLRASLRRIRGDRPSGRTPRPITALGSATFAGRRRFDAYLAEFGHRATGEIDFSRPRWREDPSGLLATIRANLEVEAMSLNFYPTTRPCAS
jgi:hypothetical protein